MADSPLKIVVDVVNGEKVKDLTAAIKLQEDAIVRWNTAMKTATPTQQATLQQSMQAAGQRIANARVELEKLQPAASAAGRGLGQLAYAIDDMQYGFNAIVNNIPQIVMGLGGGVGLAGAVGIAAVAINQLIKHWSQLTDAMQVTWSGGSVEQLEKLRQKAEEAAAAFEKLEKTRPKSEQKAGEGVSGLITEGPTEKILKDTAEAISKDALLGTALPAVIAGSAGGFGAPPTPGRSAKQAQQEKEAADLKNAKELLGLASKGDPQAMLKLEALVSRHPGAFPDEFMQDIKDLTPEGQKRIAQNQLEAQGMRNARKMGEEEKERLEKEKEDQNRLEIQGRANAKKSDKDAAIRGLEAEKDAVQKAQHDFDEQIWQKQHQGQAQIMQGGGAKNLSDMYMKNTLGDGPLELAKKAHAQREITNNKLKDIDGRLKEAHRVIINN